MFSQVFVCPRGDVRGVCGERSCGERGYGERGYGRHLLEPEADPLNQRQPPSQTRGRHPNDRVSTEVGSMHPTGMHSCRSILEN